MAFVGSGEITNVTILPAESTPEGQRQRAVDNDQLPNGETFFYMLKVDFNNGKSGGSVPKSIVAINDAPIAVADSYNVFWKTTTTIPVPGVLGSVPTAAGFDTDDDSPHALLKVVVPQVSGPANGTLTLNANGSFTYTPNATFFGVDNFSYKANDGTFTDLLGTVAMSPDSNVVTVTINVKKK